MNANDNQIVREIAAATFASFNASERKGVAFGLFPAVKMKEAQQQLDALGVDTRRNTQALAVALMEVAARTPAVGGISLAALGRVTCAHQDERTVSHNNGKLARRCASCGAVNYLDSRGWLGGAQ